MAQRHHGVYSGLVMALCIAACSSDKVVPASSAGGAGAPAAAGSPSGGTSAGVSGSAGGMAGVTNAAGGSPGSAGGPLGTGGGASGSTASPAGGSGVGGASGGAGGSPVVGGGTGGTGGTGATGATPSKTTFFVTSDTSKTANLGGLTGADARCQALAKAAGFGDHTFHAYLSAEHDPADASKPINARDRIGAGPWSNALGAMLAANVTALHALPGGNPGLFVDETGKKINGQYTGSATPLEHDILTGSSATGTLLAGKTCMDWTSTDATMTAQVGHSDGLGPGMATTGTYTSWNSAHENGSCADTAPKGGAGRLYCFAIN